MTALGYTALIMAALLIGVAGGFLAANGVRRYRLTRNSGPTVAELLQRYVHTSTNGVVLLNRFGDVVLHNPRAAELGVIHEQRADARARKAAEQALETGEAVEVDLSALERSARPGRAPTAVLGEVRPLGDGFTVVDAADESESVRLEATRRDFVANVSHELKTPAGALSLGRLLVASLALLREPIRLSLGRSVRRRYGAMIPTPHHREIGERLTEQIYRECQDKLGRGWWRR